MVVGGAADRVDADHLGAQLRQRHARQRDRDEAGDLDDPHAGQRPGVGSGRMVSVIRSELAKPPPSDELDRRRRWSRAPGWAGTGNARCPSSVVEPVSTRMVSSPASMPATTSVSIRSPTITVLSECASIRFSALRNIIGLGLPTKYGSRPVALVISAATDPVAGSGPSADGPVTSGLVAMKRAPPQDQPDGLGDRLERVRAGLAEHDEVRARCRSGCSRPRAAPWSGLPRRSRTPNRRATGRAGTPRWPAPRSRSRPPGTVEPGAQPAGRPGHAG